MLEHISIGCGRVSRKMALMIRRVSDPADTKPPLLESHCKPIAGSQTCEAESRKVSKIPRNEFSDAY